MYVNVPAVAVVDQCRRAMLGLLALATIYSQALFAESVWSEGFDTIAVQDGRMLPGKYRSLTLDLNGFKSRLDTVPHENDISLRYSNAVIVIPLPDGSSQQFRIVEAPIMSEALSRKYPDIRSFMGQGIDEPGATLRFDISPKGFHGAVISPRGNYYIDPFTGADANSSAAYISYSEQAFYQTNQEVFSELPPLPREEPADPKWNDVIQRKGSAQKNRQDDGQPRQKISSGTELRTYRLALAVTGEYTSFHGGTVEGALAAMNTTMVRVNGIYEREVAIRMVLVDNTDELIYTDADTDPYSNESGFDMLAENQANIDEIIGVDNYDIGHVFSTGGGGIAQLDAPCSSAKAEGVTGSGSPVGDPFDVEYVSHEMGHQFGADHTFNNYCGGNRASSAAHEPGSGTTIMSYAGICAPNVQNTADSYFHNKSYNDIYEFSVNGNGNSCAAVTETGNSPPVISMPEGGFSIPVSTPFALTGSATDADEDALTYSWEQFDLGPATDDSDADLTSPSGNQPIFRSWPATSDPTRVFPRVQDLASDQSTIGELLPTYGRELSFKLTVRDNQAAGGGVADDLVSFSVTGQAGPFILTNEPSGYVRNTAQTITWDVANTDQAPVSAGQVDILISFDGGQTFTDVLASEVNNDGSQEVTIPDVNNATARIKVQASANIFFAVSTADIAIESDGDGDGVSDSADVFPDDPTEWADIDNDGIGDNADTDDDNDGVPDASDNCPVVSNSDQLNSDNDAQGNACDADDDNDGAVDDQDAFPLDASEVADNDGDGTGDNADTDDDNDEVADDVDNCPAIPNPGQEDADDDGIGNVCDDDDPGIGHRWSDSDTEGGPTFAWRDISETGTEIIGLEDDNAVGPYDIGFDFMMYGDPYRQVFIHSNGVISFVDPYTDSVPPENFPMPVYADRPPMPLIAWMWDDLQALEDSHVYYQVLEDGELVIQFNNFGRYGDEIGRLDAQVIIKADGKILFQYLEFRDGIATDSATVGVENVIGSIAMQVAYDEPYLHDALAILFRMDTDRDGFDDAVDNCPYTLNSDQQDSNVNGIGDACDFYQWTDSNTADGPEFNWIDVSLTGTEVVGLYDDNHAGPFDIGFNFNFFGDTKTQFFVQTNGAISFDDQVYPYYNHATPNSHGVNDLIAWMWDDLLALSESRVFYEIVDDEKLVIQFVDFGQWDSIGLVNAEVILKPNGEITLQYLDFQSGMITDSATIGIAASFAEDEAGPGYNEVSTVPAAGVMVAYNEDYLRNELAVRFQAGSDDGGGIDTDGDGIPDDDDAFPDDPTEATDSDGDQTGDNLDNCPIVANPDQLNTDGDSEGDACDADDDNDGFSDEQEVVDGTNPLSPFSCLEGCFNLDIDEDGRVEPLSDALLAIRHLFGFSGPALIEAAISLDAQRSQAADIEQYLAADLVELDIDGNGAAEPLTDGLVLMRYLFGFEGEALIEGAVSADAIRQSAEDIADYIQARMPSE